MTIQGALQPDQQPHLWDNHITLYEEVFEPLTQELAREAIETLAIHPGAKVIDSGAGTGGAALELARRGAKVTAIDASPGMAARIRERARLAALPVEAAVMDGQRLAIPDASFDAGLSVFGVILFPDAAAGLAELRRAVKPGGRIALVTWTEPQSYELASELRAAATGVLGELPSAGLPAQLRFKEYNQFQALFEDAKLSRIEIAAVSAQLRAPSAAWLASRAAFAPGMAAMLGSFGSKREEILEAFRTQQERRFGDGPVILKARAFIGSAQVPRL
jgi:ubiquinone/menaquinone biosynthesis C-methylase UbiE